MQAMQTAAKWRHTFLSDVVVDICGYRRNGHNEQDNPSITQPLIQRRIEQQPSVVELYSARLRQEQVVSEADIDGWEQKLLADYEAGSRPVATCSEQFKLPWPSTTCD
jgi:2-oxoglutarate dehydrogenase E1 component